MVNQLANNARAAMGALLCACCIVGGAASSTRAMPASQEQPASQQLKVYFVDVEAGQATLSITPPGQSLLIDTGWPANIGKFKRRGWRWRAPIPGLP
jgi:hypothetical protein